MKRVQKSQARKAYNAGKTIVLKPSKCGWTSMFECHVSKEKSHSDSPDFDKVVNAFHYYSCNSETGLGIHYAIK